MKGMILAAGFGSRLGDLTGSLPKAMVPVGGRPMIAWAIDAMVRAGCTDLLINTHHFAEVMSEHFNTTNYGVRIRLLEEKTILGTGGGVLNARDYLKDENCFLLHNADIVSDCDLSALLDEHRRPEPIVTSGATSENGIFATLAVQNRRTSRAVLFDSELRFLGKEIWLKENAAAVDDGGGTFDAAAKVERAAAADDGADADSGRVDDSGGSTGSCEALGFCGIHVLSGRIFDMDFDEDFSDIFDIYRIAMAEGEKIKGFKLDCYWNDLGTVERISDFEQRLERDEFRR